MRLLFLIQLLYVTTVSSAGLFSQDSSSQLLLRSLVESLERNLVSKIQTSERGLLAQIRDLGDKLADVEDRLDILEKSDGEFRNTIKEQETAIGAFDTKMSTATNRIKNQFSDNLSILGLSLQQLDERLQGVETQNRMLTITVEDLNEVSEEMTEKLETVEERAAKSGSANINEEQLQEMMTKLQGGPNLINIEMRLSTMEDRFEEDLEVKLQNQTESIAAKLDDFEATQNVISEKVNSIENSTATVQSDVASTVARLDEFSMTIDMASAQSSALSDAIAGTYQQYAMMNMQIASLQSDIDEKTEDLELTVNMLNITIDEVAQEAKSGSAAAQLFEQVFKLEQRTMLLEQTSDEFKSRFEASMMNFGDTSTQLQEELSMMQQFQQTEAERVNEEWGKNKNFTTSVNQHIIFVQDTLNTIKTAAAVREEKIVKSLNAGDKAATQLKNIMKKIVTFNAMPGKIDNIQNEQANFARSQNEEFKRLKVTIGELDLSNSAIEDRLVAHDESIGSNSETLIHMKKMKSDIDLIKYTLNSQTPAVSGRGSLLSGNKAFIPSDQLDSLKSLIDNVNSDVNQLELSSNDIKTQIHTIVDDFSKLKIQSVASTTRLENAIENSKSQCEQDNNEQDLALKALKGSVSDLVSDISDFREENEDSIELIETSVANVKTSVADFTHSQRTLTSFVNNFKQDVEISISGYLTHFSKYIEQRSKGTQTTVRYIAASSDKYDPSPDQQLIVPFNDVVTDSLGSASKSGIKATVAGKYQVTATLAGVKGTTIYIKVFGSDGKLKDTVRLFEAAWNTISNSILLDLNERDYVVVGISGKGKLVDGKYNYLTMSLAEPTL